MNTFIDYQKAFLMILCLSGSLLFGVTGCENIKCNDARNSEDALMTKISELRSRAEVIEEQITSRLEVYYQSSDLPGGDDICANWKASRSQDDYYCIEASEDKVANILIAKRNKVKEELEFKTRRWALTVVNYKDCFDAATVVTATDFLDD
jgi:hypothetical protein